MDQVDQDWPATLGFSSPWGINKILRRLSEERTALNGYEPAKVTLIDDLYGFAQQRTVHSVVSNQTPIYTPIQVCPINQRLRAFQTLGQGLLDQHRHSSS